jgi:hypothetical protein
MALDIAPTRQSETAPVLDQILRRHGAAPMESLPMIGTKQPRFFKMEGRFNALDHRLGAPHVTEINDRAQDRDRHAIIAKDPENFFVQSQFGKGNFCDPVQIAVAGAIIVNRHGKSIASQHLADFSNDLDIGNPVLLGDLHDHRPTQIPGLVQSGKKRIDEITLR